MTVRVYTTPNCSQCAMTKMWLDKKGVHYTTVDLADRANINDYAAVRALGYTSAPVVAIGDITPADVPALSRTGIAGVAMVRAIMTAEDPAAVVREALAAWEGVRA